MTKRANQLLREAVQFLTSADRGQSKVDDDKWAAAERMWTANKEEGVKQREIAGKVGLSQATAQRHIACWQYRLDSGLNQTASFTEIFYTVINDSPQDREERAVERVARERPEVITRILEAQQQSQAKFVESVGQDVVDGLDVEQRLRDAEAKLFEARRALRDMLALLHESDMDAIRDSWREDFLKTLDDLSMRVDVARSLLGGTLDADLDRFLAEVSR